jgi:Holliday junction resolvase
LQAGAATAKGAQEVTERNTEKGAGAWIMTNYRRGTYYEKRCRSILEAAGYLVIESRGSHGPFDLVAVSPRGVRLIQVKSGSARLSAIDRDAIEQIKTAENVSKEYWRIQKRSEPVIQWL